MTITWTNCRVTLGDLKPWSENPRTSSRAQAKRILASFDRFGQVAPIAISPDCEVYDGHQRLSALLTVHGPGYEVEARRSSRPLTDDERRGLVLALANATGSWEWQQLSGWNTETLTEWGFDKETLKGWNNDANNLKEFLKSEQPAVDAEPQMDRAAELLEKWGVQPGDLWLIGDHRLLCADSTVQENVDIVLDGDAPEMSFIDPPYNALKSWKKDEAHGETRLDPSKWFANDNMEWDEYWEFIASLFAGVLLGHSVYVCCDYRIYGTMAEYVEAVDYDLKHCIVWKKNVWGLGKRYRFQHEFIVYACKQDAPFYGDRAQSDVWEIEIAKTTDHNTPKPPELAMKAIVNSSKEGAIILDGCCGYGTTLVACQNTGRVGRGIELEPRYVATTLERMATAFPALPIRRVE